MVPADMDVTFFLTAAWESFSPDQRFQGFQWLLGFEQANAVICERWRAGNFLGAPDRGKLLMKGTFCHLLRHFLTIPTVQPTFSAM